MLRPPKVDTVPFDAVPYNAINSVSGAMLYGADQPSSNPSFKKTEEYMDGDVDHGVFELHNLDHLKVTRKLYSRAKLGNRSQTPGNPGAGIWSFDIKPPSTDSLWNELSWYLNGNNPAGYFGPLMDPMTGLSALGSYTPGVGIIIQTPSDIDALVSRAITAMLPGIRPVDNVSLINSIIELKDFASLPRTLKNVGSLVEDSFAFLIRRPGYKTMTLRNLLRKGADVYLQAEFNILPLLSDISAVSTAIRTVRNRLRQLVSHAGTPQKRYYTVNLLDRYTGASSQKAIPLPDYMVPRNLLFGRNVLYRSASFNAQMMYNYTLPSWVTEDSLMAALLDSLGVNLNPRILWNAIPWSFVVDWLVNVNSWLDNWRTRNIEPVVNIRGFSWSFKVERYVQTYLGFDSADPCVERYDSVYKRRVGDRSALYSSLVTSGLSPKEFSLAAALAFSR
jgi:hypothetical protein